MKKTICLVTSGLEFNGNTINEKALGGSESALIYMARELAKLGNEVTVYCECDIPGVYDGVDYRHCHTFMEDEKSQFDVCIVSRFTHFLSKPLDSKLNILWIHDTGVEHPEMSMTKVDKIFCLSEFQKSIFEQRYNIDSGIFWNTTNGFDPALIQDYVPFEHKKNNYVYSSRPERGLIKLLTDIWPKITAQNPEAVLHICGYSNPNADNDTHYLKECYKQSQELIGKYTNIINHGCLKKPEYYKLLSESAYMLYPCIFPEISCINAIEAQASGCLVIGSDAFALSETIKSDTKTNLLKHQCGWDEDISYLLGNDEYDTEFLRYLDLYRDEKYEQEITKVKDEIDSYSWSNIANAWNEKLDSIFIERSESNRQIN